jgi:Pathogenicity locus
MPRSEQDTTDSQRAAILCELQMIPGVGPSIAWDLWELGYRSVQELSGQDPEEMYRASCDLRRVDVDRCMLYVFRCAVYFASHREHDPALLRWWNWKDGPAAIGESA